jgi:hypothetical protein
MWAGVLARIEAEGVRRPGLGDRFRQWVARAGESLTPWSLVPAAVAACAVLVLGVVAFYAMRGDVPETPSVAHVEPPVTPPVTPAPPPRQPANPGVGAVIPPTSPVAPIRTVKHTTPRPDQGKGPKVEPMPLQVAKAEQNYLKAIAVLTKDVERGGGPIDPKLRKPLDAIDRNITTAREAVKKNPDDPAAVLNMLSAYDDKVEVLQTLARFEASRNR